MAPPLLFRDLNVYASNAAYSFSSPSTPDAPRLIIDRPTGDIRLSEGSSSGARRISSIYGLLGIITLRLDKYVIVIDKAKPVGQINGHTIYSVVSTDLLPLRERSVRDADEDAYLSLVHQSLRSGPMYFSYSLDLTNSFQRQAQSDPALPLWKRADDRFFWNKFTQSSLISAREGVVAPRQSRGPQTALDPYILPVICGMLRITKTSIFGNPLSFILITRRSRHRAGTRYFSRGIDQAGHVSNFNETEQTIVLDNRSGKALDDTRICSYVQTRGSVPMYWAEVNELKYKPRLQVSAVEGAIPAAKRHFDEQITLYGENYLVNLVNASGREKRVKDAYESVVDALVSAPAEDQKADRKTNEALHILESSSKGTGHFDKLHYVYFDFHSETKGLKFHRAQLLLDQLETNLQNGGYYHGETSPTAGTSVRKSQSAVVRTNCMDCLDRTNVVQSMLGRHMLNRQLTDLTLLRTGQRAQDDPAFEFLFRNVWADNADVVSKSYSGTGALKTDFTRTGKRSMAGAWQDFVNSCTRYVLNNFTDGSRQDAFDLFLGAYRPDTSGLGSARHFVDTRPVPVQAVPYVLITCLFFLLVALVTSRAPNAAVWPLRTFMLFCFAIVVWSVQFMFKYGPLYVNWPKLNSPPWAVEVVQDTLDKVARDPIMGSFVAVPGRKRGDSRIGHLEEGKKRIE